MWKVRDGWSEDEVALLIRLKKQGLSHEKIAEEMKTRTRNAVSGKWRRMNAGS